MESATARSQMTSGKNPNMYLQITSLHVILFYLFSSYYLFTICLFQEGFLLANWVVNIMQWTGWLVWGGWWEQLGHPDKWDKYPGIWSLFDYRKVTVRSKILLLLHISPLFIFFFLVTTSFKTDAILFYLIWKMKNVYVETATGIQKCICCIFKHI